jgi:hypothetical protein
VTYAVNELESAAVLYVSAARDAGATWAEIGSAMGVSRQAARQRYAGALRRREALSTDWRRKSFAATGQLSVVPQRGVWEGHTMHLSGRRLTPGEQ